MDDDNWWQSHLNLHDLCRDLAEHHDYDLNDVLGVIEKPWHFDEEWQRFEARLLGEAAAVEDSRERRLGSASTL
jgi:hypothetical protein